jgi:hypothetical protein
LGEAWSKELCCERRNENAERLGVETDFRFLAIDCSSRRHGFGYASSDTAFDYGKVGLVALTPLNEQERRETAAGNYYIYDGVHKSIVLAKRLLRGETGYEPVQVLLLTPRRS